MAPHPDTDDRRGDVASAVLRVTGGSCGVVLQRTDRSWTVVGDARCDDAGCPACTGGARLASAFEATTLLDRRSGLGQAILAGSATSLRSVLVIPTTGPDGTTTAVLRSDRDGPGADPAALREAAALVVATATGRATPVPQASTAPVQEAATPAPGPVATVPTPLPPPPARAPGTHAVRGTGVDDERLARQLVGALAHELRSPSATVASTAELLRERWRELDDRRREELIAVLERQGRRLSQLVRDVAVTVLDATDELELDVRDVDVVELVTVEVEALRAVDPTRRLLLAVDPALVVRADPDRAQQVLRELVDNAHRHGGADAELELRARRDGEEAVLEVTHDGVPVPHQLRGRVFDRFVRDVGATALPSAGIGLAIARELARAMDGGLELDADGRTFRLRLPLRAERADTTAPAAAVVSG